MMPEAGEPERASWAAAYELEAMGRARDQQKKAVVRIAFGFRDLRPNVRAKLPAEAGAVSLVRDDASMAADQAYAACRSGSA